MNSIFSEESSYLADGIDFIKNDNMQVTFIPYMYDKRMFTIIIQRSTYSQ